MFIYFYLFYFIILPHRINYCGGEISEKQSLRGIEVSPKCIIRKLTNLFYTPPELFLTHLFETGKCTNKKLIITFSAVEKILYSHVYVPQKLWKWPLIKKQ